MISKKNHPSSKRSGSHRFTFQYSCGVSRTPRITETKFSDWNKRDDIKSHLKVELILILDKFGYPPVERDEVYVEIFEQAENFKKNRQ